MRLLIITPLYPPAVGGAATYFGSIVPHLAARAEIDDLTVVTERLPGEPAERTAGKLHILRQLPRHASCPPSSWLAHAQSYAQVQAWFLLRLRPLVRRCGADLIHFHTRYRGRWVYAALRGSGAPVLANLHDKLTAPAALARVADWLLCCAQGVERYAVDGGFPRTRLTTLPLACAAPAVPSPERVAAVRRRYGLDRSPYVLFVGDITANKGVYELLEAYARWRTEPPQAQLVFSGTNQEGRRFTRQIRNVLGATYLGPVPRDEDLVLMRGALVVALPSRSEGLPYVMLEALSLGVNVIAPPGIPELDAHLGESVLPEISVPAIVRGLEAAWTHHGAPSYPLEPHRPERVVSDLVRLYGRIIASAATASAGPVSDPAGDRVA